MKRLIPADTVDAEGNAWETVGENIRKGAKDFPKSTAKALVDILFPIGSVFCGENDFILSVGKWTMFTQGAGKSIVLGTSSASGSVGQRELYGTDKADTVALRLWKRVS